VLLSSNPAASAADAPHPDAWKAEPGPHQVRIHRDGWLDAARDRRLPVKVYVPDGSGGCPVVVVSHGLGGSREGLAFQGRHWASHGYVVVHLQHPGSDKSILRGVRGRKAVLSALRRRANGKQAMARALDVRFALDRLEVLQADPESVLFERLDLDRIGMAGHSFGAGTTLLMAGQVFFTPNGWRLAFGDPRIKAAIAQSAPPSRNRKRLKDVYGSIKVPCLHLTGTLDTTPVNDTTAAERRIPYDHMRGADQYLVTFEGGDHRVFSGRLRRGDDDGEYAIFRGLILQSTTAFLDAYLRDDPQARAWLAEGGFSRVLEDDGTLETRLLDEPGGAGDP
jgi:predicted dienelactone hydrolase